jgi:hypothetical protein
MGAYEAVLLLESLSAALRDAESYKSPLTSHFSLFTTAPW